MFYCLLEMVHFYTNFADWKIQLDKDAFFWDSPLLAEVFKEILRLLDK